MADAGFWIFVTLIVICIYIFRQTYTEGFSIYDSYKNDRNSYIQHSKQKYNPLSETADIRLGRFPNTNDQTIVDQVTKTMVDAMQTSDINLSLAAHSFLGVTPTLSKATIHTQKEGLFKETKKCEALLTRSSCAKLDDPLYSNCGICIHGGSPASFDNAGKHIGGLLILPDDKKNAENAVAGTASQPMYYPTAGECPSGYFFATRAECEKQVHRIECAEAGQSGGFNVGKTVEGKPIKNLSCAKVVHSNNVFVYEPAKRVFNVNLRVLAPFGTGICQVIVYDSMKKQIAQGLSSTPGVEFVITVPSVKEGDALSVSVSLEAPYRYGANRELYQIQPTTKSTSASEADSVCKRYGSTHATMADLQKALTQSPTGTEVCNPGWTADGGLAWPSQGSTQSCGTKGINQSPGTQGDVWCMGLRPPQSSDTSDTKIANWNKFQISAYGAVSTTPYKRAILMQWEMSSGLSSRIVGFESTITTIDGIGPTNIIVGSNTFTNLRTHGTFTTSPIIKVPSYNSKFVTSGDRVWFWTNRSDVRLAVFTVVIPGIFLDSFYPEDVEVSAYGPLAGSASVSAMLQPSPCKKPGQKAGAYGLSCLQSAFVAAGGDINKGELVLKNGGLTQLNAIGSIEAISAYLEGLYSIATTGIDLSGNFLGKDNADANTLINAASLNMFGFAIVSPCEGLTQDIAGNIVIVPKSGNTIDTMCLDYLWTNTGSELENGYGDVYKNVKHTYTSIGERFSGLRSTEGSLKLRKESPFTLCQRAGSASPLQANGQPNARSVIYAQSLGDIAKVQKYYDSIFQAANNPNSGEEQNKAIQQCYGITKLPPPPPPSPKTRRILSPGYGASKGWGDQSILNAWADGPNVGGGLRSKLMTGDKVVLKITSLSIDTFPEKKNNPNYTPPQDKVYYLKFDADTNQGLFVSLDEYDDAACIHTLVFAEDNTQFQTFANQNNMGIQARRNMFALMNNNGLFLTISNRVSTYASGTWPNNQPGPTQMFNWNDFSGFGKPRYPFGPYCPGAWGVLVRGEDGYISLYGNYGVQQLMEVLAM